MLGPEGIVGLEPGHITGRYPVPGSTGSEAINLAAIEFDSTDLPWRFSPARAGAANRLRPWLVLVLFVGHERLVLDVAEREITAGLIAATVEGIADIRASAEGREGVQSFLQKRKPGWLA